MFNSSKKVAAVAGAVAIGSFGLVALAPTASAGTVTPSVTCVAPAPIGTKTAPMSMTVTDLTNAGPYAPGATVRLKVDPGLSPIGSPFPLPKVDLTSTFKFGLSGAYTGNQEWVVQKYMDPLPTGQIDADPFEVDYVIPVSATPGGQLDLTWLDLNNKTISDGTDFGTVPCTPGANNGVVLSLAVKNVPPPAQVESLSPNKGELPVNVTVSAKNYTPGATVTILGLAGQAPTGDAIQATVGADGKVSGVLTVTKDNTTMIAVSEGLPPANNAGLPFTVIPSSKPGDLDQTPGGDVLPGPLAMQQASAGVTLSPITINGKPQTMTGVLNTVAIQDFRGSTKGWSLTAKTSDFTSDTGGTISKSSFKWTPNCTVTNPDSPSAVKSGANAVVDNSTLCSQDAKGAGQVTGGEFAGNAAFTLAVPSFQLAGTYTAKVTLSLS
ncbi:WxL domain-containing protein [Yinghuangia soli]|uniref:WxL domain-containing protein n=1 Tax=Yinghuangia soli TaxID=2908204 RepID=A0AA41U674_9ACTN|nr:WxL domain-containing protein [Yinghuangia soli]MCF2532652.1 WxL domain-containing protein [Yinghuangia soli]